MKRLLLFLVISFFFGELHAQAIEKLLDNKKYAVELYSGKEHDSYQTLSFSAGKMTFSEAEKYGFKNEEYKCKQKNDSTYTFLAVSKSAKNGTMTWEGKVINDLVEGTCIWTRLLENAVNYTFKGKEMKE